MWHLDASNNIDIILIWIRLFIKAFEALQINIYNLISKKEIGYIHTFLHHLFLSFESSLRHEIEDWQIELLTIVELTRSVLRSCKFWQEITKTWIFMIGKTDLWQLLTSTIHLQYSRHKFGKIYWSFCSS